MAARPESASPLPEPEASPAAKADTDEPDESKPEDLKPAGRSIDEASEEEAGTEVLERVTTEEIEVVAAPGRVPTEELEVTEEIPKAPIAVTEGRPDLIYSEGARHSSAETRATDPRPSEPADRSVSLAGLLRPTHNARPAVLPDPAPPSSDGPETPLVLDSDQIPEREAPGSGPVRESQAGDGSHGEGPDDRPSGKRRGLFGRRK